jgi:alkanesulfonate monooxygenase SsuD/methylene tetrahydromethanopterin reductase-like flavin-dependent oxidoreductase (luciferase family)
MASPIRIGVLLPTHAALPGSALGDLGLAARHAESLGLDSVWVGDHLTTGHPLVESTVALSYAAATTRRVNLGMAVMIPALRQPGWAAKQIASLQYVSGDRLLLGIGVGVAGTDEWSAAGLPSAGPAGRTDEFLSALPPLLGGQPARVGSATVTLQPAVALPEIWVGGTSDAALARAVRFGQGWLSRCLRPTSWPGGRSGFGSSRRHGTLRLRRPARWSSRT